jgi:hypothetical protein
MGQMEVAYYYTCPMSLRNISTALVDVRSCGKESSEAELQGRLNFASCCERDLVGWWEEMLIQVEAAQVGLDRALVLARPEIGSVLRQDLLCLWQGELNREHASVAMLLPSGAGRALLLQRAAQAVTVEDPESVNWNEPERTTLSTTDSVAPEMRW